ncbi:unnamed protein product [Bursaphelenchus okinawaensis]|uniref:RNA methyltransferase n=1 Tax=Bursaphelenchus okinawaensis TaxID=465554 RepID=A0A811LPQ3_9BILA|nr:unnamed protein product [Bursaphelenchus okinawaensis]CAG9127118.1 unnamed protein product [Bursaphelenchus okinawaensis]
MDEGKAKRKSLLDTPQKRRHTATSVDLRRNKVQYVNPVGGTVTDPLNVKSEHKDTKPAIIQKRKFSTRTLIKEKPAPKTTDEAERKIHRRNMKRRYKYGNFNYFHRTLHPFYTDGRTTFMCEDWFTGKNVLDIGCNAGNLTLSIAREFEPSSILGIDIDPHLIAAARKNIRHFYDKDVKTVNRFPASFALRFGPICVPPTASTDSYPNNVWFKQENYVLPDDNQLENVKAEYDVILAFGITKWVHLNHGDQGLKRFFKRIYRQLNPGGLLILEPQRTNGYKKYSKIDYEIEKNFKNIKMWPEHFKDYLTSEVVGFACCDYLETPLVEAYGCDSPILLLYKGPLEGDVADENDYNFRFSNQVDFIATPEHDPNQESDEL